MNIYLKKLATLTVCYLLTLAVIQLLFQYFQPQLADFIDHRFPDTADDDLDLPYVVKHLNQWFWIFYYSTVGLIVGSIYGKKPYMFCMALLVLNLLLFNLLRSVDEFYFWTLGILSNFGGSGAEVMILGALFTASVWLVAEVVLLFVKMTPENQLAPIIQIGRIIGVIYTVAINIVHAIPILIGVIRI